MEQWEWEQELAYSVVLQAGMDARSGPSAAIKQEAREWLTNGNEDFAEICQRAGLDASVIAAEFSRMYPRPANSRSIVPESPLHEAPPPIWDRRSSDTYKQARPASSRLPHFNHPLRVCP